MCAGRQHPTTVIQAMLLTAGCILAAAPSGTATAAPARTAARMPGEPAVPGLRVTAPPATGASPVGARGGAAVATPSSPVTPGPARVDSPAPVRATTGARDRIATATPHAAVGREPQPHGLSIAVKRTPPRRVVYLAHHGRYWNIAPVVKRVADYAARHGLSGPMFVRYLDDPTAAPAGTVRCWIGLYVNDGHDAEPPFQVGTLPPELVAETELAGPSYAPRPVHRAMREWIRRHGYHATGTVTERHHAAPDADPTHRGRRMQLEFALQESDAVTQPTHPAFDPASERTTQTGNTIGPPAQPAPPPTPPAGRNPRTPARPPIRAGAGIWPDDPVPQHDAAPPGATGHAPDGTRGDESVAAPAGSSPSITWLVAHGRYDDAARRLLPPGYTVPPEHRAWFAQIVSRLQAMGRALERMWPDRPARIAPLANAVAVRHRSASLPHVDPAAPDTEDPAGRADVPADAPSPDAPPGAIARVDVHADPAAVEKRRILHDFDALMSRIALAGVPNPPLNVEKLTPDQITAGISDLLARTRDVLHPQPEAADAGGRTATPP